MEPDVTLAQKEDQIQLLKALTVFRIVVISFFLGLLVIFQLKFGELRYPFVLSLLVAATYLVSILYLLLLKVISRYTIFLYTQLALDLVIETAIIYYAGGIASPFTFLYMFTIIASAIVLPRPSSYVVASAASILYGLLGNFELYDVIPSIALLIQYVTPPSAGYFFFTILSHIAAFFLVAYLSDILSQRVKRTFLALLSKSRDLTYLQAFHENVIAHMGSGFLALDLERVVISTNQAAVKILGQDMQSLKHRRFEEFFPETSTNSLLPDKGADYTEVGSAETVYRPPNGNEKHLAVTASLFKDSTEKVMGYIVIFQDVTSLKKMEEAVARADRLDSIGRIAAGLAHEIRNPLGSISGSIQMLQDRAGDRESSRRLMSIIIRETDRLNTIINNFLSSASPIQKMLKNISLAEIINDTVLLFCNDAEYSGRVEIETDLDESVELEADPKALKQVFWNLLLNSAQAMENGGKIFISMTQPGDGGGHNRECKLVFSDTGCGIPENDFTKIFEPFYTTKEKGTGFGLSTALKIIENHKGSLNVESELGKGTTFIIYLPASPYKT